MATDDPLWRAIAAARARWSPEAPPLSPPPTEWGQPSPLGGDGKGQSRQGFARSVPTVPGVTTEKQDASPRTPQEAALDAWGEWQERAAILEYEGQHARAWAEALASLECGYSEPPRPETF